MHGTEQSSEVWNRWEAKSGSAVLLTRYTSLLTISMYLLYCCFNKQNYNKAGQGNALRVEAGKMRLTCGQQKYKLLTEVRQKQFHQGWA